MNATRSPSLLKTSTFSNKDCENTFYMSAMIISPGTAKLKIIFEIYNTL